MIGCTLSPAKSAPRTAPPIPALTGQRRRSHACASARRGTSCAAGRPGAGRYLSPAPARSAAHLALPARRRPAPAHAASAAGARLQRRVLHERRRRAAALALSRCSSSTPSARSLFTKSAAAARSLPAARISITESTAWPEHTSGRTPRVARGTHLVQTGGIGLRAREPAARVLDLRAAHARARRPPPTSLRKGLAPARSSSSAISTMAGLAFSTAALSAVRPS